MKVVLRFGAAALIAAVLTPLGVVTAIADGSGVGPPPPCPPRSIVEQDAQGAYYLVVRDPTQDCGYREVPLPVPPVPGVPTPSP
ncbi:MAG: hypothetical protein ACYDAY_03675 [Candidatus Dormibacteria bacterium]